MVTTASIARVAALIGDPTRASMLQALMEGRALTAAELAGVARVAPQTASGHLAQLTTAGLAEEGQPTSPNAKATAARPRWPDRAGLAAGRQHPAETHDEALRVPQGYGKPLARNPNFPKRL